MNHEERIIVENHIKKIEEIIEKAEKKYGVSILKESGSVFYTGYGTIINPNGVYLLGINPGGDRKEIKTPVREQLNKFLFEKEQYYNEYIDGDWGKNDGLQIAIKDAFDKLNLSLRETYGSNLIFIRTKSEKEIKNKINFSSYIYIHDYIINYILKPSIIISFGKTPYNIIRNHWDEAKVDSHPLNICQKKGSPCYCESKEGDKFLCYLPHSSHSHYKKFSECGHAIEILRSKIKDVMKNRDTFNPPKWKFKYS